MTNLAKILSAASIAGACQLLSAQPATYENFVLNIPQGAALVDGVPTYYSDLRLESTIEGNFALTAAVQNNLVTVESVVANVAESLPVQVSLSVSGTKSVPCVELQPAAVFRNDFAFTVVLAETLLGPAESCIAVLDPFETTIALDVAGLNAGTYTVTVNGTETSFEL